MRILTGMYRGRVLKTVRDLSVRPATGRVRQTIFDILVNRIDFEGLNVLDLFAGSGSLGFEALSRGARHAVMVELDGIAAGMIEENAAALGCERRVEVVRADAMLYLAGTRDRFGLIFADPPYAFSETATIPDRVFAGGALLPGGYLLIEHSSSLYFAEGPRYTARLQKRFGRTLVTFFQHLEQA